MKMEYMEIVWIVVKTAVYLVLLGNMGPHLNYGNAHRLYCRIISKLKCSHFAFLNCTQILDNLAILQKQLAALRIQQFLDLRKDDWIKLFHVEHLCRVKTKKPSFVPAH